MRLFLFISTIALPFALSPQAHAWGKRGHSIVCQTAAYLASEDQPDASEPFFLKVHSFDLGYYCNVPDIIWKRPPTYEKEFFNHFMDMEIFERKFPVKKGEDGDVPYALSRNAFDEKYKDFPKDAGRSWWRLRELEERLDELTQKLKDKKLSSKEHQDMQVQWLLVSGIMGHYIGDMSMPLHVTENYDGKMSGQKGVHHYFEESAVDELFLQRNFGLEESVYKKALSLWSAYEQRAEKKDVFTLVKELTKDSQNEVSTVMKMDKKTGRKSIDRASQAFRSLIVERLAKGALLEALVLKNHLGWEYDGKKFYQFLENPPFIEPPGDKGLPKK